MVAGNEIRARDSNRGKSRELLFRFSKKKPTWENKGEVRKGLLEVKFWGNIQEKH